MSRYVVQARRFSGTLAAPTRNDSDSADADDWREAVRVAEDMARRGWVVWIMEDRHDGVAPSAPFAPPSVPPGGRYVTVAEWRTTGERVR